MVTWEERTIRNAKRLKRGACSPRNTHSTKIERVGRLIYEKKERKSMVEEHNYPAPYPTEEGQKTSSSKHRKNNLATRVGKDRLPGNFRKG